MLVAGAGLVGSLVTREARRAGWEVILADPTPGDAASRLAHAVVRRAWHRGGDRERARWALSVYSDLGAFRALQARVTHYRKPTPRWARDWFLVDPLVPLLEPDLHDGVVRMRDGYAELESGARLDIDVGVWCDGIGDADRVSWGAMAQRPSSEPPGLRVHTYAPRRAVMLSTLDGHERLGASVGASATSATVTLHRLLVIAATAGMIDSAEGWEVRVGRRGHRSRPLERLDARTWRLSGLGRMGYALAPAYAVELLAAIGA